MVSTLDSNVTVLAGTAPLSDLPPEAAEGAAGGVWTLAGDRLIIADRAGPATVLVPSEAVRLLAVDLPLPSAARRIAALPFAVEDRIAEPLDQVHIALGAELAPRRYLVAVVAHTTMAAWVEMADAAGLAHAALVPDALALPRPEEGWTAEHAGGRALVRVADGTGFAAPAALLPAAWEAAGRPPVQADGDPLPAPVEATPTTLSPVADRLLSPPVDLRQGLYARRRRPLPRIARRLATVLGAAIAAHIVIAAADGLMLRAIAERRAEETRVLLAQKAPGVPFGEDLRTTVADLIPPAAGAPSAFGPGLARLGSALAPLGAVTARSLLFENDRLVMELETADPGLAARARAVLASGGVAGTVTQAPGIVRIEAPAR